MLRRLAPFRNWARDAGDQPVVDIGKLRVELLESFLEQRPTIGIGVRIFACRNWLWERYRRTLVGLCVHYGFTLVGLWEQNGCWKFGFENRLTASLLGTEN